MADIIYMNRIQKKADIEGVFKALQTVQDFCNNQYQEDCDTGKCPLFKWCKVSGDREEFPCNWTLHN